VLQARQPERVLHGQQQRVVVVGGVVGDVLLTLVGDHDGGDAAAAGVEAAAAGAWLTRVGEVVLVPGDLDRVGALVPHRGVHDVAHDAAHVGVTRGNEPVGVAAGAGAVHVVALVGHHEAEVWQLAGCQVGGEVGVGNHIGQRALGAGEVQERVVLGGVQG